MSKNNTGGHSIFGQGGFVEVNTTTLPEIFNKNNIAVCDLLKMDIEGAEYDVLYNLPRKYFEMIKHIRMEVHDFDQEFKNHNYLISFLKSKGYIVKYYKGAILFADRE